MTTLNAILSPGVPILDHMLIFLPQVEMTRTY
eukprot:CAMPEP_0196997988 /NCGR_PEP_ID=MMETSP1380-20130617/3483_1 /TAXON_ID=5936 /ORGANISM="Euplotes crassus, Strain CT5" /LENGTH=31 /DNA_ID= /DNA_START= /DNA_END= /DNA_ORIENTATION=